MRDPDNISGLFTSPDIADLAAVVDELCVEANREGLLLDLPPSEIRPWIGELVFDLQVAHRRSADELKAAVLASIRPHWSLTGQRAE